MTFLELVNEVLARMRQDSVLTVIGSDDASAQIVIKMVNDAKTKVENAFNWNALRTTWDFDTVIGQETYALTGSDTYVVIDYAAMSTYGYFLDTTDKKTLMFKNFGSQVNSKPSMFAVTGSNASREVTIGLYPKPEAVTAVKVEGWKNQAALALDADVLLIPSLPVIYEALALAARERGEVGGQTSLEIFGVAKGHLQDAIALDAALSPHDTIWVSI